MNADSRDFKFTDGIERELIRHGVAEAGTSNPAQGLGPTLKWILAVALAFASLFVIASNEL